MEPPGRTSPVSADEIVRMAAELDRMDLTSGRQKLQETTARLAATLNGVQSAVPRDRLFTYENSNNNNNNNNDNNIVPAAAESEEDRANLDLIGNFDFYYGHSLQAARDGLRENPCFIKQRCPITGNIPLHAAVNMLRIRPDCYEGTIFLIAALVGAGADREVENNLGQTPWGLAIESDDSLVIALFTLDEAVTDEKLLHMAIEHDKKMFVAHLQKPDFRLAFERDSVNFVTQLEDDPTNVYEKTKNFYGKHSQIVGYVHPITKNSTLHDAVQNYLNNKTFGIFEVVVLLEMGADKHCKNVQDESALERAQNKGNIIFRELMKLDKPTLADLYNIALEYSQIDPTLVEWLHNF
ncbi:MAG: hypothetical protein JSR37_02920 [Verrucomicrobia bacterium]|nr:hypothetical protein [Verrucomicrobiota bacterium]MBS0636033.1 hypothetical protein [Verrucomicrobiota bacterium]